MPRAGARSKGANAPRTPEPPRAVDEHRQEPHPLERLGQPQVEPPEGKVGAVPVRGRPGGPLRREQVRLRLQHRYEAEIVVQLSEHRRGEGAADGAAVGAAGRARHLGANLRDAGPCEAPEAREH